MIFLTTPSCTHPLSHGENGCPNSLLELDCDFLDLAGKREWQLVDEIHWRTDIHALGACLRHFDVGRQRSRLIQDARSSVV